MTGLPFEYSALTERPPLELPGGARVAVYLLMSVEYFVPGKPAVSLYGGTASFEVDPLNYAWRDYGPRVGVWRLIDAIDRHGLPVSCSINSDACLHYPQIVQAGRDRDWAWVAHGKNNSTMWTGMSPDEERVLLKEVVETIADSTGSRPRGWIGPAFTETLHTYELAPEFGIEYTIDWANDDQPYMLATREPIVAIPHPNEMHDIQQLYVQKRSVDELVAGMTEAIDVLEDEGRGGAVFGVGMHPFLLGQPQRIRAFERFLADLAGRKDVWVTTTDAISDWYLEATGGETT